MVMASESRDLKASIALSATSPAPTTKSLQLETFPKILRTNSHRTFPRFTCPLEIPVFVLAHFAA